jgi:hypothetical protein
MHMALSSSDGSKGALESKVLWSLKKKQSAGLESGLFFGLKSGLF